MNSSKLNEIISALSEETGVSTEDVEKVVRRLGLAEALEPNAERVDVRNLRIAVLPLQL